MTSSRTVPPRTPVPPPSRAVPPRHPGTAPPGPPRLTQPPRRRHQLRRRPARRRPLAADILAAAAGLGLGFSFALALNSESMSAMHAAGGINTAIGRVSGMLAGYAMVITVLLSARIPPLERAIGQDRLIVWHRKLGPWGLYLLVVHAVFITIGYAQAAKTGLLHEIYLLLWTYSGVLAATAGAALLVLAGVTSYRRARRRMKYETWWAVHLYTYLGLGVSFIHQVDTGAPFIGHPLATAWWYFLWIGAAVTVLLFRFGLPAWRSVRHDLRVAGVAQVGVATWAVTLTGRRLDRLPVAGGQFMMWRFMRRELWWQAHPYSLSAAPTDGRLRITVKELGDHSTALSCMPMGTRVAFEGPYGVFTEDSRTCRDVVLIGAGVGTTPLRALLEELPASSHAVVILRGSTLHDITHLDEFAELLNSRRGRLKPITGPRREVRLDVVGLRKLVSDIARRDVFICGPDEFTRSIIQASLAAGVPKERIHYEDFSF